MSRRYFVAIELHDDEWEGDESDLATWIDSAMNTEASLTKPDIDPTVYSRLGDLLADHPLDGLVQS